VDELSFKVSSALKNIIGKDLITDDFIAIFELVKNSYDANSKKVNIVFEKDKIVIFDDGKGMSLNDIKNKWLFVAYSAKRDGSEDAEYVNGGNPNYRHNIKKKYYAGAKGIGRFSCDRLGKHLTLTTRKPEADFTEQVRVNWSSFEQDSTAEFVDIMVQHDTISHIFSHGTMLEITNLHSSWDRDKMQKLKFSLEKLINPFDSQEFEIFIVCKQEEINDKNEKLSRNKVNGSVGNFIFEKLNLKTTQIKILIHDEWIETELTDRGVLIYRIRERNPYDSFLAEASFNIFYLNTIAKANFTRQMGIESVNFGSIFFFKNGFRVYPFGNVGDDSLGIDYRHQQGYSRFLGTRDILGRIELVTDNDLAFKEVSSRDGGLVNTYEYKQLITLFFDKALKPLERYLGNVQWGLGWDKKGYETEKKMLENDKNQEDFSIIKKNLGSQIHIAELIRRLSDNQDIEILEYSRDLMSVFDEHLENVNPAVFKDLSKIAKRTKDENLSRDVVFLEKKYNGLLKIKEETELKLKEAEVKQKKAEEQRLKEAEARIKAEEQKKIEVEARKKAELEKKEAELLKREAEIKRKEAEQNAKKEQEKRKEVEAEKEQIKKELESETKVRLFQSSLIGTEKKQILGLQHHIGHSSSRIKRNAELLSKSKTISDADMNRIVVIIEEATKIQSVSKFITKANFVVEAEEIIKDFVQFIEEYIQEIYLSPKPLIETESNLKIQTKNNCKKFVIKFRPLEIVILVDNFINNADKANASNICFDFSVSESNLILLIKDDGKGISECHINKVFDLGFTTTDGSGIGLSTIKTTVDNLGGFIGVSSNESGGTIFKIELKS
jgi:Histidine kinase-, DNA gyrase B-, and HSP90-like ATPase.